MADDDDGVPDELRDLRKRREAARRGGDGGEWIDDGLDSDDW